MSRGNKTPISSIVDFWSKRVDECDLNIDWSEGEERCWRCGARTNLMRCHIVPRSLGGEDAPDNLVVLCRECHEQGPNVSDREIMWDWLMAYKTEGYISLELEEGFREYEFIYGRSVLDDIGFLLQGGLPDNPDALFRLCLENISNCGIHFGLSRSNKATAAGLIRMTLKEKAAELGVELPDNRKPSLTRGRHAKFWIDGDL